MDETPLHESEPNERRHGGERTNGKQRRVQKRKATKVLPVTDQQTPSSRRTSSSPLAGSCGWAPVPHQNAPGTQTRSSCPPTSRGPFRPTFHGCRMSNILEQYGSVVKRKLPARAFAHQPVPLSTDTKLIASLLGVEHSSVQATLPDNTQ